MKKHRTEHADFVLRFAEKLQREGNVVYSKVPQDYWDQKERRVINGKIDLVAVKNGTVTAYELETSGLQYKSEAKLKAFECNAAYIICHDGKAKRIK